MKTHVAIYIGAITAANLLVFAFGPWFSPINALLLIGLDMSLRDKLHDHYGFWKSLSIVGVAGVISYLLNPTIAQIAIASVASFTLSGIADALVYQGLIKKAPLVRMNASNTAGAAVDSILFPTLAFGVFMPWVMLLQFAAKVVGGAVAAYFLARVESKEPLQSVYLCGPINGRSDDDATTWREFIKANYSGQCLDPMSRDYRGRELEKGIAAEIVAGDFEDIQQSGVILVYFDKPSVGTAMEVFYAKHVLSKPVVVVNASSAPLSPWLMHHCDIVVPSLTDALAFIETSK